MSFKINLLKIRDGTNVKRQQCREKKATHNIVKIFKQAEGVGQFLLADYHENAN
jgi:hypothetical protein